MNVSSVGSPAQYMPANASSASSGAVMGKVLSQEKADGQEAEDLIASASPQTSGSTGSNVNTYA
jgi:hypothetical protein